jgi:ATP-dependent RNA helicase DDX60
VIILIPLLQPALLFNFDRTDCEIMAQDLLRALQSAEDEWRKNNTSWARKVRDWEAWKSRAKERERLADKSKKMKKDADSPAVPSQEHSWESTFDPDDPSPQFSFAGSHTSYSLADLEKDIEGMRWNTSIQQWTFDALRRGIAVHHSGMNKQYRSLVERWVILFYICCPRFHLNDILLVFSVWASCEWSLQQVCLLM